MQFLADPNPSFHQTQALARALGINLVDARAAGLLSRADLGGLVAKCRACAFPEVCTVWLSEGAGPAAKAPEFCPNGAALDRLAGAVGGR